MNAQVESNLYYSGCCSVLKLVRAYAMAYKGSLSVAQELLRPVFERCGLRLPHCTVPLPACK